MSCNANSRQTFPLLDTGIACHRRDLKVELAEGSPNDCLQLWYKMQ